jgi:GntR family transcriptional regulator, transcriptional repressor for pyruvate dehydrogenase complex
MARVQPKESTSGAVFERLVRDIVSGGHVPGARLPSERDLAIQLGASRPTLREALRRLSEWGLIAARRGSGVVVRPRRDWSIDVLPHYLSHGAAARGPEQLGALVKDLLDVRRGLFVEVVRIVGPRLRKESLQPARERIEAAWAARGNIEDFVKEDFEAIRALVEAADFLPALWMLGGLAGVYAAIAARLTGAAMAPPDYLSSYNRIFDALGSGRTQTACKELQSYLERHDKRLLAAMGIK